MLVPLDGPESTELEDSFASRDYGEKTATRAACWMQSARVPYTFRWLIVPVCAGEDEKVRLELATEDALLFS